MCLRVATTTLSFACDAQLRICV